jgi:glucose-6-phosphate isomerase
MPLDITLHNIDLDTNALRDKAITTLQQIPTPAFLTYTEDIAALRTALAPYQQYKNILLIGNGGSIWAFMPFYTALVDRLEGKSVVALTDMEPDYLKVVKAKYPVENTLVVVVSKSGSTVGVIEDLLTLSEYAHLYVTDATSTLGQIGERRGVTTLAHPPVGGRYSSFTACAYVPAILTGLPVEEIEAGGRGFYREYSDLANPSNSALKVALALHELEKQDYTELFLPIYSNFLQTFGMIATQLFHESFGKAGQGITVIAAQAPESQHHTNQRFFGGRKNMVGCFLHVVNQTDNQTRVSVPDELKDIPLRTGRLAGLDGVRLTDSFESEYVGTFTDAKNQGIPLIDIAVADVTGYSTGALMAFWHYLTVYSAALRDVDPFDQPQVEASKVISFEQRLESKR